MVLEVVCQFLDALVRDVEADAIADGSKLPEKGLTDKANANNTYASIGVGLHADGRSYAPV